MERATDAYVLDSLYMKGQLALPVRGLLYRKYPGDYMVGRRLDGPIAGEYVVIATYPTRPSRAQLEIDFFEDSRERDKDLSLVDRLKKVIPNFGY